MASIDKEIWKDVKGFEGLYQVSNHGRVRSVDRWITYPSGKKYFYKSKILAKYTNAGGYNPVSMWKNSKDKKSFVHNLVMEAFVGEKPKGYDVNHIDGNKQNNHLSNLEYVTRSENMLHAFENGLCEKTRKKSKRGYNGVKWMVINTQTGIFYESIAEAARAHNIAVGRLEKQLKGVRRKTLPFERLEKGVNQQGV